MYVGSNQVIQFVENAVNNFDQQVALLVLQRGRHEQWQDLVEQGACSKLPSFVCDLTQSRLGQDRRGRGESDSDRDPQLRELSLKRSDDF